jgi:hypothetical protein
MVAPTNMVLTFPQAMASRAFGYGFATFFMSNIWKVPREEDFLTWKRLCYTQWIAPMMNEFGSVRPIVEAHRVAFGDTDSVFISVVDTHPDSMSKKRKRESSDDHGPQAKKARFVPKKRKRADEAHAPNKRAKLVGAVQCKPKRKADCSPAETIQLSKKQRVH